MTPPTYPPSYLASNENHGPFPLENHQIIPMKIAIWVKYPTSFQTAPNIPFRLKDVPVNFNHKKFLAQIYKVVPSKLCLLVYNPINYFDISPINLVKLELFAPTERVFVATGVPPCKLCQFRLTSAISPSLHLSILAGLKRFLSWCLRSCQPCDVEKIGVCQWVWAPAT